jgi:NAD(P)-dependent dehydrogenase (short-subunit alcohol dehydrogenase family)
MHDNLINNKSVVITGGNKGIGLEITKAFLNAGYWVVVGSRSGISDELRSNNRIRSLNVDVCNESSHQQLAELAIEIAGSLDVYVNNVGLSAWRSITSIDTDFLDQMLNINLKSAFWGCKVASKYLVNGGSIINISSLAGKRGSANNAAYVATKFGVNGLTQSMAKELGSRGIRVNALCPVLIETEGLMKALKESFSPAAGKDPLDFIDLFKKNNASLNRLPSGKEVGDMCVMLASDSASAITGQCINVDCGVFPQ